MIRERRSAFSQLLQRLVVIAGYMIFGALILYFPLWFGYFKQDATLNVCVFVETFTYDAIERFQKETGIKVNVTYVEIDEQTYSKFRINQGKDYDVLNLSDAFVHRLGSEGMLHEIDHSKVPNISFVYQELRNQVYDEENKYSVPHKWYVYGVVYDRAFFDVDQSQMSWNYVFVDPQQLYRQNLVPSPYRVCMVDDGRDASLLTALYLFENIETLSVGNLDMVKQTLIEQKRWVEAYTTHSSQYFLFSNITPIAVMTSNYMRKIYAHSNRFEFAIPKEGSLLIVENFVIPKKSKKVEMAHRFINFMLRNDIARLNSKVFEYSSANQTANDHIDESIRLNTHMFPDAKTFKRLHIPLLTPEVFKLVEKGWLHVGFS